MDKYMNFLAKDITFRDYLAAKAMQALILTERNKHFVSETKMTVKESYRYADAMLAEREK